MNRTSLFAVFVVITGCLDVPTLPGFDGDTGGSTYTATFRTTQGLVASYSMRTVSSTLVVDDTGSAQDLMRSSPGSHEPGRIRTNGSATGPIVASSQRIAQSGAWTIETWMDFIGGRSGDIVEIGNLRLSSRVGSGRHTLSLGGPERSLQAEGGMSHGLRHIVATSDGAIVRLYVDGYLVGASVEPWTDPFGDTLRWGGDGFDGALEFLALYDRALTHGEIALHTLVGADPQENNARDESGARYYVWQSEFDRYRAVDALEVTISETESRPGRIELSSTQRVLQRLELPAQFPSERLVNARLRHLSGELQDGSTVDLYPMLTSWTTDAQWDMRDLDSRWGTAGAEGVADRQSQPVASDTISYGALEPGRSYLRFDITENVRSWLAGEEFFGWMFTSDSVVSDPDAELDSYDSGDLFAGRPSLFLVGAAADVPTAPAAPVVRSTLVGTRDVQLDWDGDAPLYEVYVDSELYARVRAKSILLVEPPETAELHVAGADHHGQVSGPTPVDNPR